MAGHIFYDPAARAFVGITDEDLTSWRKAYPACDLDVEVAKAAAWVHANPRKGRKGNYEKFLVSWLAREQDRGDTRGSPQAGPVETKSERDARILRERQEDEVLRQRSTQSDTAKGRT
jgi:hypothetical protein